MDHIEIKSQIQFVMIFVGFNIQWKLYFPYFLEF